MALGFYLVQNEGAWRWELRLVYSQRCIAQSQAEFATEEATAFAVQKFNEFIGQKYRTYREGGTAWKAPEAQA